MLLTPAADARRQDAVGRPRPDGDRLRPLPLGRADRARRGARHPPRHRRAARRPRSAWSLRTALIMAAMTALIAALGMVPMAQGGRRLPDRAGGLRPARHPGLGRAADGAAARSARRSASCGAARAAAARGRLRARRACSRSPAARCSATYLAATRGAARPDRPAVDARRPVAARRRRCSRRSRSPAACRRRRRRSPAGALALGAISAVCHVLTVAAYRRAEATALAPFLYFNLLTAAAVGFLWFGETLGLVEPRSASARSPPAAS